ncbi:MAG: hypothetical protein KZQ63_13390, partial [Candidatus Thiodiazotropha sp. (ex Lucinoma aequizonata)]|nr:hypothetical protein [Candidatus Thiodiazotropha sp. (ex Lucinoma aequizonata)]MCU7900570.1 hypothetical protein [Candidatus Thiodiazotropha sp. (ex Lucinoma aequizonata)]MCU7912914.1 hypothetical protein [Candidatus Thiodiazotropha sp. (ex Lucinoma aequizonata)]
RSGHNRLSKIESILVDWDVPKSFTRSKTRLLPAIAAAGERPHFHRCLGIQGDTQYAIVLVGFRVNLMKLFESQVSEFKMVQICSKFPITRTPIAS